MKKIQHYILIFLLGSMFCISCQKLDRTPEVNISETEFWNTTNDIRLFVNGFYNKNLLPNYTGYGTVGIYGLDADQGSDNMVRFDYDRFNLNGERILPTSDKNYNWEEIRNINYFLQNYKKTPVAFSEIKSYVGEAYFFRALAYFILLKRYGDLPWVNTPIAQNDEALLKAPRLSRGVIVDSLMADLDMAIGYLKEGKATDLRVTKPIALALKVRLGLYEGTWEKYHAGTDFGVKGSDGTKYLRQAEAAAQQIINSGIYSLDNVGKHFGYWSLFNQTDYSGSNEIMFWRKYDPNANLSNYWSTYMRMGNGRGITKNMVDDYLCKDGLPIGLSNLYKGDDSLRMVIDGRDPRLEQTICVNDKNHPLTINNPNSPGNNYFELPAFTGAQEDKCVTGYQIYKGLQTDYSKQVINKGDNGVIYFRYAEILLSLAEAKAELGTLNQADVDATINKLRKRVGMPELNMSDIVKDPNWIFPKLTPIINEIRRERRVELAAEGFRHDDIWRWAAADKLILGWKPKGAKRNQWNHFVKAGKLKAEELNAYQVDNQGYIDVYKAQPAMSNGYKFKLDRDYLEPIPMDQITLTGKAVQQNPGWPNIPKKTDP